MREGLVSSKAFPPVVGVLEHSATPVCQRQGSKCIKLRLRGALFPALPYLAGPNIFSVLVPMGRGPGKAGRTCMATLAQGLGPEASAVSWVLGALGLCAHLLPLLWDRWQATDPSAPSSMPFQVSILLQAPTHPWATTRRGPTRQGPTLAQGATQPRSWSLRGLPPQ